jgi:hypothetical protein
MRSNANDGRGATSKYQLFLDSDFWAAMKTNARSRCIGARSSSFYVDPPEAMRTAVLNRWAN